MADITQQVEQINEEEVGEQNELTVNYNYVLRKLGQALLNKNEPKVQKWETFLKTVASGKSQVGTRTPLAGTPEWVTLEVANGGFATGGYMAGGPLQSHEEELHKYFFNEASKSPEACRSALNTEMLTERGLAYLETLLENSLFEVRVPEEGALLAVAWLVKKGHNKEASEVISQISPWFNQLRFYPIPSLSPLTMGTSVSVAPVREVMDSLASRQTPYLMTLNRNIIDDALPLYDEFVGVILKTMKGTLQPSVVKDGDKEVIVGDLPFQLHDEETKKAVKSVIEKINKLPNNLKTQRFKKRHTKLLLDLAKRFVNLLNKEITPRDCEVARMILAKVNKKRGLPGSEKHSAMREKQKKEVANIGTLEHFGTLLINRLSPLRTKDGLDNIAEILRPVGEKEASGVMKAGMSIPHTFVEKLKRAKKAPLEELCNEGLVPSAEVLGVICPALVAGVVASGQTDRVFATLLGAIYQAFKSRRSLLLLNLEKQVQIEELPWYSELEKHSKPKVSSGKSNETEGLASQSILEDVVMITLKTWPETMMPNKFVGVLYDLSAQAAKADGVRLALPFLKEVASDIFMGTFSETFLGNAKMAAKMLKGTLYEDYYEIPFGEVANFSKPAQLDELCKPANAIRYDVASNGKMIEKCMIVTAHNLALVFQKLNMKERLGPILPELPKKTLNAIILETKNLDSMDWQTRLQHVKNAAYAFRQLVFYLSMIPKDDVDNFFVWANERLNKIKDEAFRQRLSKPILSLQHTWKKEADPNKCIFYGWVMKGEGKHFMLP